MFYLDMRTIVVGQVLVVSICTLGTFMLWRHARARYAGLGYLAANYALQAVCTGLIMLRGQIPDLLSIFAANSFGMAGQVLLCVGMAKFVGKPGRERLGWAAFTVFMTGLYYLSVSRPSLPARNVLFCVFFTFFCARSVWLLLRGAPAGIRDVSKLVVYSLGGFIFINMLRVGFALFGHPAYDFFHEQSSDSLLFFTYSALTVSLAFGILLMVTRRLQADMQADFDGRAKAEKQLLESAGQLELALASAGMGVWRFDIKNNLRHFDARVCALLGLEAEIFKGSAEEFYLALHPDDREGVRAALKRTIENDAPYAPEYRVVWPDASVHHAAARGRLRRDSEGRPDHIDGLVWDITERKKGEAEIRASEERFQKAFHCAPFLMSLSEIATGRYLEVNEKFCEVTGYSREELLGKTSTEIGWVTPEVRQRLVKESNGTSLRIPEIELRAKGGRPVICSYACERVALSGKHIMIAIAEDLTGRKKAEAALKNSEEHFRRVVDSAPEAIFIQSGGRFAYMNAACAALLGAAGPEALLGGEFMKAVAPEYAGLVKERINFQLETGRAAPPRELQFVRLDGGRVDIESVEVPISFLGKPSHLVFTRDISDRKRAEAAIRSAQKLESLGTLAGGIAHDFNNLLTGITGNLSMLRNAGAGSGEDQELIKEAETACRTAKGLARQLLTFASGGEPVKSPLDMTTLVRESVPFSLRGSSVSASVEDGEALAVMGDREQLFQVVNNLVINAAQAMPGGGAVKVKLSRSELKAGDLPGLPAGAYVVAAFHDTGVGIQPDMLPRVFDPYFSTKGKGRGLGLSVCRSVVIKHGGQITVQSEPGKGSVFMVYLPLTDARPQEAAEKVPAKSGSGRILIMEDEEIVYKALRRMLKELGYEAEVTLHGAEAIAAWKTAKASGRPFAAAIMDLTIAGGMGGEEAVKLVKALDPAARVIVSSGYSDGPVMAEYGAYGFDASLSKPYQLEELSAVLAKVLA